MGEGGYLIAFIAAQRLAELFLARRNTAHLKAAGGVEFGRAHYYLIVALHMVWLAGLWAFGRNRAVDPVFLAIFVLLQAGRIWVIGSLGRRWTTRIIVVPGQPLIACGPYRWLRHPNYLIVALEIAVVPLALGLPLFAGIFTLLNGAILWHRVHLENAALTAVAAKRPSLANETGRL
jgi:methyltransferase